MTSIVNVFAAPPAVTVVESNVFVTESWTSSTMSTLSLPVAGPSSSDCADALFETPVALSVVEATW